MSPRAQVLVLLGSLAGCAPEPASSVELAQSLTEVVDLCRAMMLEHAIVVLTTDLDPGPKPAQLATAAFESATRASPCATVTAPGVNDVRIDFGDAGNCSVVGRDFTGAVQVRFSEPVVTSRLATITYSELASEGVLLNGTTQVTWGPDDTRRLVSELRLEAGDRHVEIQSDRIQRSHDGALQIDGWHRWQTLMGRWRMELAAWSLVGGELMPGRGLARIATPFDHEVVLDFTGPGPEGAMVRANGGRRDHVFAVAADGEIIDLGDD